VRIKEKIPLSRRLGRTRGSSRKGRGIREARPPFSEIVLKDNHILERR
jgi:hypothetical protein